MLRTYFMLLVLTALGHTPFQLENKVRAETALATPVTNSTCLSGEFTCSSGLCLSPEAVCDFSNDCGDRSDEVHCRHRQTKCWSWQSPCLKDGRCQSSHFQCGNGKCINFTLACNGLDDCGDRSDEQRAVPGLKCSYGSRSDVCVLPQRYVNDSNTECREKTDHCYNSQGIFVCFKCFDNRLLIGHTQICDGVIDCFDLSDECACPSDVRPAVCNNLCTSPSQCQMKTFTCGNFTRNITDICNRRIDCPDGEDELYCRKLASSSLISCPGNKKNATTLTAFKCDGRPECFDLSDECGAGCPHEAPFCNLAASFLSREKLFTPCHTSNKERYHLTVVDICDGAWSPCVPRIPEEEANCSARLDCQSGNFISIDRSLACNGYRDCDDGADEITCTGRFHCETSIAPVSVPQSFMFDDYWDCHDGSDECPSTTLKNSSFASKTEMIHNTFLKVWLWLMALMALTGNTFVIMKTFSSMQKSRKMSPVTKSNHFLIFNLALADFLMGVYLLAMAIKSAQYSGKYCFFDKLWRTGSTCRAFGVLSVISCEASVMVLSVMTAVRLYVVSRPIAAQSLDFRYVPLVTTTMWLLAIFLAVLPVSSIFTDGITASAWISSKFLNESSISLPTAISLSDTIGVLSPVSAPLTSYSNRALLWTDVQNFLKENSSGNAIQGLFGYYSLNSVCVPEWFVTTKSPGWQFSIVVVSINLILFLFVVSAYLVIYLKSTAQAKVRGTGSLDRASAMQRKIIKLVVTDFSCWVPICVMVFIHFSEAVTLGGIYYVVTAVILLPINSVLNPLLYSDGHGYILEACQRAWRTIRNHFSRFLRSGGFLTQRQGQGNSELVQNENAADSDTGAIPVTTQKMKTKL